VVKICGRSPAKLRWNARRDTDHFDRLEYQARNHLVAGRRLVALVQTVDASFSADGLGKRDATWTAAEWMSDSHE